MMGGASSLDLAAFKSMMQKTKPSTAVHLAVEAFGVFEASEGTIRCAQFERDMSKGKNPLTKEQCRELCSHADVVGDGSFDYVAFVPYMMDPKNCVRNAQEDDSQKVIKRFKFGQKEDEKGGGATKTSS